MSVVVLRIAWLTLVALVLALLLLAFAPPDGAVSQFPLSNSLEDAQRILRFPGTLGSLNLLRASLTLDMLFLLAYGFLLRETARYHRDSFASARLTRVANWAMNLPFAVMACDAAENLSGLWILAQIAHTPFPVPWLFRVLAAASALKWILAGTTLVMLGILWHGAQRGQPMGRPKRITILLTAALYIAGGVGCFVVLITKGASPKLVTASTAALILQIPLLHLSGLLIRLLWLLRIPLGEFALLASFAPLAFAPGKPLLGGMLDLEQNGSSIYLLSVAAFLLAFAAIIQTRIILQNCFDRLNDETLHDAALLGERPLITYTGIFSALLLAFAAAWTSSGPNGASAPKLCAAALFGFATAFGLLLLAEAIQALSAHKADCSSRPQYVFRTSQLPIIGQLLCGFYESPAPSWLERLQDVWRRCLQVLNFSGLGPGYLDDTGRLRPGHSLATAMLAVSAMLYVLVLIGKSPMNIKAQGLPTVPTLVSVLILSLWLGWLLAGAAFFLDRFRLPLITTLFAGAAVLSNCGQSDHVFRLEKNQGTFVLKSPGNILRARMQHHPAADPILIAAAGGGIQAAGWTTRVLQGLAESADSSLRDRIALMSAVSGGSVGALYTGAYLHDNFGKAKENAMEQSLDEVAWGLVGPDLLRPIFRPFPSYWDRGFALESTFEARIAGNGGTTIREWADRAGAEFPAFLFNATVVETGQPIAFATTQFPSIAYSTRYTSSLSGGPLSISAAQLFGLSPDGQTQSDRGLHVATAARLSATFPYVSPAAAPLAEGDQNPLTPYHLVDGGYYDNFGLAGLSQWLDDALEELGGAAPKSVVAVVIRAPVDPLAGARKWSWLHQLTAPPLAYLATRGYAQWAGGSAALELLQDKWRGRVDIRPLLLAYPYPDTSIRPPVHASPLCADRPESWKLTAAQRQCIEDSWQDLWAQRHQEIMTALKPASASNTNHP